MDIKSYEGFVSESVARTPLESIIDGEGRVIASLPSALEDRADIGSLPRCEFVFDTARDAKEFEDTTYGSGFWKELYGYDSLSDDNDFAGVASAMRRFGNRIVGRTLYVYCYDPKDSGELGERCGNAAKTCDFKKVRFLL